MPKPFKKKQNFKCKLPRSWESKKKTKSIGNHNIPWFIFSFFVLFRQNPPCIILKSMDSMNVFVISLPPCFFIWFYPFGIHLILYLSVYIPRSLPFSIYSLSLALLFNSHYFHFFFFFFFSLVQQQFGPVCSCYQ